AFTQFEACDRLLGARHHRLLACDGTQLYNRRIHDLGVGDSLTQSHVDDDLLDPWDLHVVLVAKPLFELGDNRLFVEFLHSRRLTRCHFFHASAALVSGAGITAPLLATRTFLPSRSSYFTRVGSPVFGSRGITLLMASACGI